MINAEIINQIFYITIEGHLSYDDFLREYERVTKTDEAFIGFISDGRKMNVFRSPIDQLRLAAHHKRHNFHKPNAILMDDGSGKVMWGKIYIHLTSAPNTRIFTSEEAAIGWIRTFVQRADRRA